VFTKGEPLIIAHRGASASAPENTLAAFRLAHDEGADGVEFDVRLARDGVPVCIHDFTLTRTARRREQVSALTSRELAETDAGSWFNLKRPRAARPAYAREHVPTLDAALGLLHAWARAVYVELKLEPGEDCAPLVARVVESIRRHGLEDRAVVESFRLEAVAEVKRVAANVLTAALFERSLKRPAPSARRVIERAISCGADELALQRTLARPALVAAARRAGLRTLVWTADHPVWARRALSLGLRAIITNHPARMRAALDALRPDSG
jgi:glycerophosphoryl diester phosphodiesterase